MSDPLERIAASLERLEAVLIPAAEAYVSDRNASRRADEVIAEAYRKANEVMRPYYEEQQRKWRQQLAELEQT